MGRDAGSLSKIWAFLAEQAVKLGYGSAYRRYFVAHPPRCLAGFAVAPAALSGVSFDGHGHELNTIYRLSCRCGHDRHHVLGHFLRHPDHHDVLEFVSPLALRCGRCGLTTELMDTDIHGFDGEVGQPVTMRGEGERQEFACDDCGPTSFRIWTRFEYPNDLFDADSREFRGRQQDLFTWFSLVGWCAGCSNLSTITDFECA